jgi:uncharacterized protein YcbK (DUF882 family)
MKTRQSTSVRASGYRSILSETSERQVPRKLDGHTEHREGTAADHRVDRYR